MAHIQFTIPHELTEKEAVDRIKKAVSENRKKYKDLVAVSKETWKGNVGSVAATARAYEVSGTITVLPKIIEIDAEVPWAVSLMKGKIEKMLRAQAKHILATK